MSREDTSHIETFFALATYFARLHIRDNHISILRFLLIHILFGANIVSLYIEEYGNVA
jgi:hypothetical protein